MEEIVLIGYGGHAKSVADCIERMGKYRIAGYTDPVIQDCSYNYLGTDDELKNIYENGIHNAVITVGYLGKGNIREILFDKLKKIGFELPNIIDPSAIVSNNAIMGEGNFIGKLAVINHSAKIGNTCIINTKSLVEHDCVVNDFAHVAVGAVLCGEVEIKKAAFIGANATIIQCKTIEERKIIPAGYVVR